MRVAKYRHISSLVLLASITLSLLVANTTYAGIATFPVIGNTSYSNDFNSPRGDEKHNAIDIIASKRQKIVAAAGGRITYVAYPQPSWGYMVRVASSDGYEYDYIHINNDNPGTDDGKGGGMFAFAPGVRRGNAVNKGQLLGYVGDSGNAENTVSHLHFEVRKDGKPYNPYSKLNSVPHIKTPVPAPTAPSEIVPYGEQKYNINVALGDVTSDGIPETIVAAGKTAGPKVKIYNNAKQEIASFLPFQQKKYGDGIDVAVGDVNNDGRNEIVVGGREADGSRIAVYSYNGGVVTKLSEFLVDSGVLTIARVAVADTDGDGTAEIISGNGPGKSPRIKRYAMNGTKLGDFAPLESTYMGGIDVAAGDVGGVDNKAEIVVSRLTSGDAVVNIFNYDGTLQQQFFAYNGHQGGARVAVGNVNVSTPKSEIVTTPTTASPRLRVFNGMGTRLSERFPLEDWWRGYYDPAATTGMTKIGTGIGRRSSVQD